MNNSEIMALINDLESRYQVDRWTFDNIYVWPFIRVVLSFNLFHHYHAGSPSGGSPSTSPGSRILRLAKSNLMFLGAFVRDFRMNACPNGTADVVFFSDGISFTLLEGRWYEKFCDPLIGILKRQHRTTFLVTPLDGYAVPRATPSLFVQPCIDLVKIKNYLFPKPADVSNEFSDEHPRCCTYLAGQGIPVPLMPFRMVLAYTRMIQGIAGRYCSLLARLRPSIVFLVSFYGIEGMAVNLACRKLGIPSVDLQHGVQGDSHAAYAQWSKLPAAGYELLPSFFWCWSEKDAAAIRKWGASVSQWHHAVAGGNVWLTLWQDGSDPVVARHDVVLRQALARHPGSINILVTLQPGLADQSILADLLQAARRGRPEWRWWFRLHPCMLQERERIRVLLQRNGITRYELDLASDPPLYALLRNVELHVTHSSSTVIEAGQFSIPSIITHAFGTDLFPDEVRSGWARPAYTAEQIVAAIQEQLSALPGLRHRTTAAVTPPDAVVANTVTQMLDHWHRTRPRS